MKFDNCPWTVALPETFRPITYPTVKPDKYAVSDYGNIKNIQTGYIKEQRNFNGYRVCNLMKSDGNQDRYLVHRLVAWEFCPGRDLNLTVNHIDCNKSNNYYENLEWVSLLENTKHAIAHNLLNNRTSRLLTEEELHYFFQTFQDPNITYETMSTLIKEKFGLEVSVSTLRNIKQKGTQHYIDPIRSQYPPIPPRNRNYLKGELHVGSKLTVDSVNRIVDLYLNTFLTLSEIAFKINEEFGIQVNAKTIFKIIRRQRWRDATFQYASALEARRLERKEKTS